MMMYICIHIVPVVVSLYMYVVILAFLKAMAEITFIYIATSVLFTSCPGKRPGKRPTTFKCSIVLRP